MLAIDDKQSLSVQVRSIMAFRFLSEEETSDLISVSEIFSYEEGEPVVSEGEVSPFMFGILSGTVGVSVGEPEGNMVYVNSLGAGDIFGEAGIFTRVPRTATVTALENSVVLRLDRRELAQFLERHPASGNKILLIVIYGLLRKLKLVNRELAYERKSDLKQEDVDAMVESLFGEKAT